ncbi:Protein STB6 [Spathaspora sp. JA1]|nr:Protein STB6 [Spathaspora sp. JA1]
MSSFVWQVYSPNTLAGYMPKPIAPPSNGATPTQNGSTPPINGLTSPPPIHSQRNSITSHNDFNNANDLITYIIPDFNAVKYFHKEFINSGEFHLLEESQVCGFEIYLVDQWVNNRNIGTVVTVYTGNESSKISVVKFTILKKQVKYYPNRFQQYLNELITNHSRMKKMENERPVIPSRNGSVASGGATTLGITTTGTSGSTGGNSAGSATVAGGTGGSTDNNSVCFVTNLTSLPSNLNLIPIPQGDIRKIESSFIINSNLRKLHCTGRSISLISDKISDANEGKFRQMYKIYNVPVKFASRELINIIQTCLFYFDLLDVRYCNGLLCNKTEEAITNWWNLIGLPHFNVKPNTKKDGILPSMTVAAIISLVLSIRLRIQLFGGCDVPKDPFDFESFMISIGQFQRQVKLIKTRKLDMETLNKLFTITNARLLPEKHGGNYFYSMAYGDTNDPEYYDSSKRKYGKELKKLTNVMKSTVQGHIEEIQPNSNNANPTTGRIMNKISKLTISPLDVETYDLEPLVKHHLTGKILIRLFYGIHNNTQMNIASAIGDVVNAAASSTLATADKLIDQVKPIDHHHSNKRNSARFDNPYVFESLRDKIANSQEIAMIDNRYSRGFNFKRFGLQSKRNLPIKPKHFTQPVNTHVKIEPVEDKVVPSSMVDNFLELHPDNTSYVESIGKASKTSSIVNTTIPAALHPISQFQQDLNRRNSYPFILDHEANLNSLVVSKVDTKVNPYLITNRPRSFSCSCIEPGASSTSTSTKLSKLYLKNINMLMKYENLRKLYFESKGGDVPVNNKSIEHSYQLMNLELIKLNNLTIQMNSHRSKILQEEFQDNLKYNLNLLTTTIDRLCYETRIVNKRIDELEDNYQFFEMKNNEVQKKMTRIINNSIHSAKFKLVYPDINERREIIIKLTGDELQQDNSQVDSSLIFKVYILMIYEFFVKMITMFRANMNVDRIRQAWGKLDPNRTIINTAYFYIRPKRDEEQSESIPSDSEVNKEPSDSSSPNGVLTDRAK